ncbi:MAG TPA: Wzz/FepE/Etk N-terminal domain-containing protein [bacterium]
MNEKEREFTFGDFARLFKSRGWFIVACSVLIGLFLGIVALASFPVYEAKGSLQLTTQGGGFGLVTEMLSYAGSSNPINSEIEIVRSPGVARAVIDQLSLDVKIVDETHHGPFTRALGLIFSDRMNRGLRSFRITGAEFPPGSINKTFYIRFTGSDSGFTVKGPSGDLGSGKLNQPFVSEQISFTATSMLGPAGTRFSLKPIPEHEALKSYLDTIRVTTLGGTLRTNLLQVSYKSSEPSLASDIVNAIIDEYERRDREWKTSQGQDVIGDLEARLETASEELLQAEAELQAYQDSNGIVNLTDEATLSLNYLAQREAEGVNLDMRISLLSNIINGLESGVTADDFTVPPGLASDPLIQQLASDHARLMVELNDLLLDYTDGHPFVIAKREAIMEIRRNIIDTISTTIAGLASQQHQLDAVISGLENDLYTIPGAKKELYDLERNRSVADEIYRLVIRKLEEAKMLENNLERGNRVVDYAIPPAKPISPSIKKNLGIGLGLGFILGLILAFIFQIFGVTIRHADELLDFVPRSNIVALKNGTVSDIRKATGITALAISKCENQILCYAVPGKSSRKGTVAFESIISELSEVIDPVLIVDGTTHDRESGFFNVATAPGISDFAGGKNISTFKHGKNINILSPGSNPSGLVSSKKIVMDSIREMSGKMAATVIYVPGLADDPSSRGWIKLATGAILLLHKNHDSRADIIDIVDLCKSENVPILGAILVD